jgi:Cof subfamily protein (haloacid dehalogenase superfamily)
MSEIQLVLTDFDGTVAEVGKHVVSDKVRQAVIACENKGVRMVPVTGRFHALAKPVLELLGFEDLGIFDNGASIMNAKTGEVVWSQWLEPARVKQLAELFVPVSHRIDYTPDHDYHYVAPDENDRIALISESTSHVFGLMRKENAEAVAEQLKQIPDITFYTAPDTDGDEEYVGIQVNHASANKFHGVEALRKIVDVAKEHTLAIGDGDNDISLFENAGLKIAMGNATELLKAQADYVVGSVTEDGFAEAMERFVLN